MQKIYILREVIGMIDKSIINKVIALAKQEKEKYFEKYPQGEAVDVFDDIINEHDDNDLVAYLKKLDDEQILSLLALMYLGREGVEENTASKNYIRYINYLKNQDDDKIIRIYQMSDKFCLDEYLENGLNLIASN